MSLYSRLTTVAIGALEYAAARLRASPRDGQAADGGRGEDLAVPGPWTDRESDVLESITPEVLAQILRRRDEGDLEAWADLANKARRTYPHLHSQLLLREMGPQETEFEVVAGKGSSKVRAEYARDACEELFQEWQERGWSRWTADIVGAKNFPASMQEVTWERFGGVVAPVNLTRLAERRLSYACDRFDPDPWALRLWDQNDPSSDFGALYGVKVNALHPDKFIVHEPRVVGGHQASEGHFAVTCWYWLFGVYSWKHLMALLETCGRPPVIGTYAAGGAQADGALKKSNGDRMATAEDIAIGRRAIAAMSGSLRAMIPDTVRLEALKFEIPPNPAQILTSDKVDALISKAINLTTGVTDIVAGARASHESADKRAMTPYRVDCRDVGRVGTELFARFVRANPDRFKGAAPPRLRASHEEALDLAVFTASIKSAVDAGARIPEPWFNEQLGVPAPKDGERLLGDPIPGRAPKPPAVDPTKPADPAALPPASTP